MKYKGYEAFTEFSKEDDLFIGKVINCDDILVFDGKTESQCEESFHNVVDDYLRDCEKSKGK